MISPSWLWIPLTLFAAAAQTVRNTAQRHLTAELGTLGATLVRFLYGMPVLAVWLCLVLLVGGHPQPTLTSAFGGWVVVAALSQMAGTALLLRAMEERSFAIGLVYSKSEVIQVALFSVLFLGETISMLAISAIVVATLGVVLLSPRPPALDGKKRSWADPAAFYGLASGSAFAISVVGYRGANLALHAGSPFLAAAETLFWSQLLQAVLLTAWLLARNPSIVLGVLRQWRISAFAGVAGASASLANVTALALAPASQVRTLILIEVVFSYVVSRRVFHESMNRRELAGILLVMAGVVLIVSTAH
ncbi:DMT family transporter [Reyranella sp. MMS21-HV4-11]|uniref:DMT family transporter n=1 Tax=Reyranella humidisoli TaxID=2849149 RepID=A0ABS6IQI3_9HYPH|nr:DMT family transporter [Reyranella sp. MMS21-HV4-11]MBU8876869.1 DMT family transporter [Reyranella sp. MMS21-HV4-11]